MTCRRLKRNVEYILKSVFQKNFQRSFERKIVLFSWHPTLSQWQLKWTIHSQLKEACTIAFMVPKTDILPWNTLHAQSGDLYSSKKVLSTKFKTITILIAMLSEWKNAWYPENSPCMPRLLYVVGSLLLT